MSLRCDRPSCEWPAKLAGTGQAGKAGLSVAFWHRFVSWPFCAPTWRKFDLL